MGSDAWHQRRRKLWERDAGLCGFCGKPVDLLKMDLDHIVPRADGGSNDDSNLRVAHPLCNRIAGGKISRAHLRYAPIARRMNLDDEERDAETSIKLRLPPDLHKALCELARAENRSLNSEIVHLLEQLRQPPPDADKSGQQRGTPAAMPRYKFPRAFNRRPRGGG